MSIKMPRPHVPWVKILYVLFAATLLAALLFFRFTLSAGG